MPGTDASPPRAHRHARRGHGPHGARGPGEWHGPHGWHGPPEWHLPRWATLWVPVIASFVVQVPAAIWAARTAGLERAEALPGVLLAIAGPLLLIGARRFPGPVVVLLAIATSVDLFVGPRSGAPYVALAFGIVGAIVRGARLWAWVSIGVCWIGVLVAGIALGREDWTPLRIAGTTFGILVVFGIAEALRARRERLAEFRRLADERHRSAAQAERMRIARELHDVLAHSLSQINVQAGVGLHLMERQPEQAAAALASIKETSKAALDEVRAVLGALRAENGAAPAPLGPEPRLDRLPALVGATPGLEVDLDERIGGDVPAAVQLALYRIVQESLTNVTRHSTATRVTVRLWRDGPDIRLEVRDDGRPSGPAGEGEGRGILGMRERAELLGGRLTAGPAEPGGFLVSATIPVYPAGATGEAPR